MTLDCNVILFPSHLTSAHGLLAPNRVPNQTQYEDPSKMI
jgi:hypothetical protein